MRKYIYFIGRNENNYVNMDFECVEFEITIFKKYSVMFNMQFKFNFLRWKFIINIYKYILKNYKIYIFHYLYIK